MATAMWRATIGPLTIAMATLLAATPPAAAEEPPDGARLLTSAHPACHMCHSLGERGNRHGPLDGVGRKWSADDLRSWLVEPDVMRARTGSTRKPPMPSYVDHLAPSEIDALVAYLRGLR